MIKQALPCTTSFLLFVLRCSLIVCSYSGGRDGVVSAWHATSPSSGQHGLEPTCINRVQAHTHWINDLVLAHGGQAVISASSDTSVKLWRPAAADAAVPTSLGSHGDYVKCVTSPGADSPWVASAGLDGHVILWDLAGQGQRLKFPVAEATSEKGSVYALASTRSIIATGGPDSVVRMHDVRSGQRVAQYIGHSDNIRSLLISENQDYIISCSSDKTVKVWSVAAGRCLSNLAMHSDSVWSLWSDHPNLGYFFSGDRAGVVAKTDTRAVPSGSIDQAVSFAVCQESHGINRMLAANGMIWTATAKSNLNAWRDVGFAPSALSIDPASASRKDGGRARNFSFSLNSHQAEGATIPMSCVIRMPAQLGSISNSARHRNRLSTYHSIAKRGSLAGADSDFGAFGPLRNSPDLVIGGKEGIVKSNILNNKRLLVTADTGGNVVLWDLLECRQVQSFGKRGIDEVVKEINTKDIVSSWCSIDTNIGAVVCTLDEKRAFDGEAYADEMPEASGKQISEDLRINLGIWVLRNLFDDFVRRENRLDEEYRRRLRDEAAVHPATLATPLPAPALTVDGPVRGSSTSPAPRSQPPAGNGPSQYGIGSATPFLGATPTPAGKALDAAVSSHSTGPPPTDDKGGRSVLSVDYFSSRGVEEGTDTASNASQNEESSEASRNSSSKDGGPASFGQRFRSTFSSKKGRTSSQLSAPTQLKATTSGEKPDSDGQATPMANGIAKSEKRSTESLLLEMRREYARKAPENKGVEMESMLRQCLPEEALLLRADPHTTILIQEEEEPGTSLAVTDLFQGSPLDLGRQASVLEKVMPYWLGALLLKVRLPRLLVV